MAIAQKVMSFSIAQFKEADDQASSKRAVLDLNPSPGRRCSTSGGQRRAKMELAPAAAHIPARSSNGTISS